MTDAGGVSWEGVAAILAVASSAFGLYKIGTARGKQDGKISELEKDLIALQSRVDKGFEEFTNRLTRMEERIFQYILNSTKQIRRDISRVSDKQYNIEPSGEDDDDEKPIR